MPTSDGLVPPANRLLAALPPWEYASLRPLLERVPLLLRTALYEAGDPISYVHFPLSGVVSLLIPPENPDADMDCGVEVGMVGREGMAGLAVLLGLPTTPIRCLVQLPGEALRMGVEAFREHIRRDSCLYGLLLRYTHAFLAQVSQSVACNSQHRVEQRLCRWLLMMHGCADADQFPLTHEFLAAMLGVRRATISVAARKLQDTGLIEYGRGQLTVRSRPGLESRACGCHRLIQGEIERLFA